MRETIEIIDTGSTAPLPEAKPHTDTEEYRDEPNYILRTQLFVCLFAAVVLYFVWRQSGGMWHDLSRTLLHILEDGISFSGQDELTRFTDEVRGLFGNLVEAFAVMH